MSLSRFDDRYDFSLGIWNDLSSEPLLVVAQADETIFLVRRSHPDEPLLDSSLREDSYDRVRRSSGCLVQHQYLRGACFRRVSDALIGMDRSTLPSADPSTVWLTHLIEASEVLAASVEPCDPAIVKAFSHRLEMRTDVRPLF